MKEDSTFEMKGPNFVKVMKTIKEEPDTTDDNQIFLNNEDNVDDLITPVTVSKEEFEQVMKEEPAFETHMDITPTVFVDVGEPNFVVKTESEFESESDKTGISSAIREGDTSSKPDTAESHTK